ncbi:hypothetical protein J6590_083920 [Homalodisca vitripennis]|nr:hypothetical protein J6590_083920 [Homalodisca vitripennis]
MVQARQKPSPFTVIMDRSLIKDWDKSLQPFFEDFQKLAKKQKFTIMKYVIIKYKSDGTVVCSSTFVPTYSPFKFMNTVNKQTLGEIQPATVPFPEVSEAKIIDVRSLMKYLTADDEIWLEQIFEENS